MAFKFQTNDDVKFIHDEALLKKAEALRSSIKREEIKPLRVVELTEDSSKLNGWGVI